MATFDRRVSNNRPVLDILILMEPKAAKKQLEFQRPVE